MAEVGALRVTLGLDSADFTRSLAEINRKLKAVESEFKAAGGSIKGFENTLEGLQAKSDMLTRKIALQSARVQELKRRYEESAATKGKEAAETEKLLIQYNKAVGELKKLENELQQTSAKLDKLSQDVNKNATVWGKMHAKFNEVGQRMQDLGSRMQSAGQGIAMSFGAVTTAIGGALGFAVKKSMDFEAQIDRVGAIAGATPAELEKLKKSALDLGASTSKSATEVAQAQEIMATMGYKTNQIIAAMPGIIAAAEASGEDMALVADTVSAALNAFGLEASEASRVADVLAQAANDSAAGIQDMQYTFKYAAPIARTLGISLEQLGAATEIMANAGIRGETAGTTLRAALIRLSDPPKEAAAMLRELGVRITDSSGKMLPFNQIIAQLSKSTEKMSNAQKLAALSTIFGTEAASGMLTVIEAGPEKFDELTKSLQNSAGASQEAAQKMKDNLKGSLEELQGAFETAQITIGNALAPAIQKVAGYIQQLVDWFNNLSPSTQKTIATIGAVSAVLAALGAAIGVVLTVIGTAASGFGVLAGAIGAISAPVAIAVAAIAGLIAIGVAVYKNWDEIKAKAIEVWGAIKDWFSQTLESIKQFFSNTWNNIKDFTSSTWDSIKQTTVNVWNAIKAGVMAIITPFINGITNIFNGMKDGLRTIFEGVKQYFSGVWQAIKNIFLGAVLLIIDLVTGDFEALKNDAKAIFENLKNALSNIWEGIKKVFSGAVEAIKGFVSAAWSNIQSTTSSVFNGIRSLALNIWNGIKSAISSAVNTAKSAVSNAFSSMKSAVSSIMGGIKSTITSMWNSAVSFLEGIDLYSIGKNIIQGLLNGISSMASAVWEKAKEIAESVKSSIRKALGIHSPSRETEKLGKYTGEGFAKGIESKKKDVERASKKNAEAAKKAFEEAFKQAQYNFKIGKIDEVQYISALRNILKNYAKTSDQVRQVNLEIKKAQDEQAKKAAEVAKKTFEQGKQAIEYQKQIRNVSLEQELQWWNNLAKLFKKGTKERIEAEKEYARVKEEITKRNFENEKKWFEEKKYYGQLSLTQELESLNTVAKRYKEGTEERIYWEREIYRVKKEINDKLLAANNEYAEKVKEINERLQQDELKAKEEYETRVKEINDRLAEDERKLTEEYQKAVDDRTKALYSFAGIFDEIKRKDDVTGQGLLKNLSDQVSAFKDWQANIVSLANRGIDEGLLQELREMGPKAVDEIAALNSLSDEELNQYVQLWREKNALARTQAINELEGMRLETQSKIQQLRATASTELEQVKIEYTNKIAQLRAQAAAELEQHKNEWMAKIKEITEGTKTELNLMTASMADIGKNTMQGLIDGLNSMMGPLRQKAQEIANIVQSTMKATLKIKSPSRVMRDEIGKWIPLGLAEGINRNINAVIAATNRMAQAAIPTIPNLNGAAAGAIGYGTMQTNNIAKYGNVYINVTVPVNDLEQIRTVNDFFNRLGMKVRQA
ncbi:tail protein [Geobacillus thermopakistaniensis]|uniref:Tail protein n=1 Tax=Geobacillus thermopakistaniensis (strain MAS1) TaxID=1408282 RepID=A0A7U9J978_GEOTM|nr:phage tail tape measure protein [Geobacillus sp. MAS1]ESU71111.1 tail protein [Geobacillus sp. MAS1]